MNKKQQDFINTIEKHYFQLLTNPDFQENFRAIFNQLLYHAQPPSYKGLKRHAVFQRHPATLYHYPSRTSSGIPLLIVYAFINRPTILDIQKNRSFIKKLLENHIEVYLLEWNDPHPQDSQKSLSHYIQIIDSCIKRMNAKKINLSGICQGGTLSLCYAALFPQHVHTLITLVTPVEFQQSLLTTLLKGIDTRKLITLMGNIPGQYLAYGLQSLKPFRFLKMAGVDINFFISMEKWINDCPDHPGLAFHEFIHHFYQKNDLARGQLFIGKRRVDLSKLMMPILNIYAAHDHLIPTDSSTALKDLAGSLSYQELCFPVGHIGLFVSQKALNYIPAYIAAWIKNYT